ncbi:MAG: hypothetical protein ACFFCK_10050 [Promethearchaeota archaeon]
MQLELYMIRNGLFGQDYGMKLLLASVGLAFCLVYWFRTKKRDYLVVFLAGVVIWSCFETLITVLSIRYIEDAVLFGINIHWLSASIIRGSSEGSVVALVGISFGDFIPNRQTRWRAIPAAVLLLSFFVARTLLTGLPIRNVGGVVLSRREVFAWPSVLFFLALLAFNIYWYLRVGDQSNKTRVRNMFIAILVFSAIWSVAQYIANVRWIEVFSGAIYLQAAPLVEFLVFAWDIIIEVATCYISFYTIPHRLGLVGH